jgi:integrase
MARAKRGFAQVTQQKSGRYAVRYSLPSGKRVSAGRTFARKIDAEAWAAHRRRELESGATNVAPQRMTFGAYAATWLAGRLVGGRPLKARTREHYQFILDTHLLPVFGELHLSEITPADVREWHATTLVNRPTMRGQTYGLLRTICASAVNDELIAANPCRIVGAGRPAAVHKAIPATVAELEQLTAAMPERFRLMVTLAGWCALRFGETIELRRKDIDLSAEVIRVRRAAVRVSNPKHVADLVGFPTKSDVLVTTPKTDSSIRDVAIPPHLIPAIEQHLEEHVGPGPNALLFPGTRGGHLTPSTLMHHFYAARASIGRDDLRWHDLRHTGATLAAATGASLAELMARLGHSTPQAAMRYQHAAQGRDREIAALLSKLAQS